MNQLSIGLFMTMKKNIQLISWDLDDTLWPLSSTNIMINAEKSVYQFLTKQLSIESLPNFTQWTKLLYKTLKTEEKWLYDKTQGRYNALFTILTEMLSRKEAEKIASQAMELFLKKRSRVTFFPNMLSILIELSMEFEFAVMSNGNANLKMIGIDHLFQYNSSSEKANTSKPSIEIFDYLCKISNYEPHQILHIGDDLNCDIFPAEKKGLSAIWMNTQKSTHAYKGLTATTPDNLKKIILTYFRNND